MKDIFSHLTLATLHHAYLLPQADEETAEALHAFLEGEKINTAGNPDVYNALYTTFTVEDADALRSQHMLRALTGEKKFFIIRFSAMTSEAEHALLKLLEEPVAHAHFFFLTPQGATFKDTLLSRMQILESNGNNENKKNAEEFLKLSLEKKLAYITKFIKAFDEEEDTGRVRNACIQFVSGITKTLHDSKHELIESNPALFRELEKCSEYLHERGSSPKMILEHIALLL